MEIKKISDFLGGWFIGDFDPTMFGSSYFEAAVKDYNAGDEEPAHYHNIADEFTVIGVGTVEINGLTYHEGDIIHVKAKEIVKFKAITKVKTFVIKIPSIKDDKFNV